MSITVDIDSNSGFCAGVTRAINTAESHLASHDGRLYSLGAIVHNDAELERLGKKGLVTIDRDDLSEMINAGGEYLLIRAHGEPPSTYRTAEGLGFNIVDCTCPVVLKLQGSIREAYERMRKENNGGQIIIYGKIGHAEVLGLVGQAEGNAIVVENLAMLEKYIAEGRISLRHRIEIFSQTTKNPAEYSRICSRLEELMARENELSVERFKGRGLLQIHNTICSQVAFQRTGPLRQMQVVEHPHIPYRNKGRVEESVVPSGRQGRSLRSCIHSEMASRGSSPRHIGIQLGNVNFAYQGQFYIFAA